MPSIEEGNKMIGGGVVPLGFDSSFNLILDQDGNIINKVSHVEITDDEYEEAAKIVFESNKTIDTFKMSDRTWIYSIREMGGYISIRRGEDSIKYNTVGVFQVSFLDVTDSYKALFQLGITLVIVGMSMFGAIFIISLYFAEKAIEPIKKGWFKQKQFIADASHELKTPLAIITANTEAMSVSKNDEKWLGHIKDETVRMNKLVNNLLYLAKVEDEIDINIENIQFNMSIIVSDVILSMESIIYEKGIEFESHIDNDIIVSGDNNQLKKVITILLDNAVKYVNNEGKILISLFKNKKNAIFRISNTGDGIQAENLSKIFDRFYRTDEARENNNSYGLGLSIAQSAVHKMNGSIKVDSVINSSTTFEISLNLYKD